MSTADCIQEYLEFLQDFSQEELRYRANPETWSLGQLFSHLIHDTIYYLDQIEACVSSKQEQLSGKTDAGQEIFKQGRFPPIKIKNPDVPDPSNSESKEELIRLLQSLHKEVSEWSKVIDECDSKYKARHDGFGWLTAKEWLELAGMHFTHHLRQKEELEQLLPAKD